MTKFSDSHSGDKKFYTGKGRKSDRDIEDSDDRRQNEFLERYEKIYKREQEKERIAKKRLKQSRKAKRAWRKRQERLKGL